MKKKKKKKKKKKLTIYPWFQWNNENGLTLILFNFYNIINKNTNKKNFFINILLIKSIKTELLVFPLYLKKIKKLKLIYKIE